MGILKYLLGLTTSPTPSELGNAGESGIACSLYRANRFGHEGQVLRNVFIPTYNGNTSEIDLLFITTKGIFVIESKNYSGWIFGKESNQKWTSTLYAGKSFFRPRSEKHHFYNPIKQNESHIKNLKRYLKTEIRTFSLVVFSDDCEFKSLEYDRNKTTVCHQREVYRIVGELWDAQDEVLTSEQVEQIYQKLLPLKDTDGTKKIEHVQKLQDRFSSKDTCPACGAPLVMRTAKKGRNAGSQFLGCSNYPKCTYTRNI